MLKNSNHLTLQNDLNSQASCLNKWCKSNKMTINPQKCRILAICPKSNKNVIDFFIKLDGTVISAGYSVKYLGINLDLNLNFSKLIEVIENKLSRSLTIMFKLKPVLPQNALLKLYYAMVHPCLIYGLVAWGSTFPSYIEKLIILSYQNKTVKLIGGGNYLDRATPYYSKLNILKLPDQRWSRGRKARGQGHKKISRPRTDPLEAKDTVASVLQKKRRFSKHFFKQSQKKVFKIFFQAKKVFKNFFSGDFHLRKTKKGLCKFSARFLALSNKISTIQKMVLSSSRGQGNLRGLEASRPRTSKSVLEDSTSVPDLYKLEIAKFVDRFMHNTLP